MANAILLVSCPDQMGIVARLVNFIFERHGNIVHADQHTDAAAGLFLTRIEWGLEGFSLERNAIAEAFRPIGNALGADWELHFSDEKPRIAVWVSKQEHCLIDLLWRAEAGELPAEIALILSNHRELEPIAKRHGLNFHYMAITKETKRKQEQAELELLRKERIGLVVLAKYMQILSDEFVAQCPRIINIHHSFLPAFAGANPYRRAFDRGVKIIGATAHYVTKELDEGPIIEQDVVRISHRDTVSDLIRKGKDLERLVLSRAVRYHLENRVLVYRNKTVVFI